MDTLSLFLDATIRAATPLAFAALGETVSERAGVINVGLEGSLLGGAFGALVGATHFGVVGGLVGAVAGGALIALVFAVLVVLFRTDQIIAGTAMTMFSLGITGSLYRAMYGSGGAALSIETLHPFAVPGLAHLPLLGTALFAQPASTYLLFLLAPATWWWMYRTHAGLALRACGEAPAAARSAGVRVGLIRATSIIFSGALAGIGGGVLVIAQSGTFAEGMSAGRGFVAIAIVVLGRWHPLGAIAAAILFGAASALQTLFQSFGSAVPYQLFLALPYLLTLVGLAGFGRRQRAPAALGKLLDDR